MLDLLTRRMTDEASQIDQDLTTLASSWQGAAHDAYASAVSRISAGLRTAAQDVGQLTNALREIGSALQDSQGTIPVPTSMANAVAQANQDLAAGRVAVAPTDDEFRVALAGQTSITAAAVVSPAVTSAYSDYQTQAFGIYQTLSSNVENLVATFPQIGQTMQGLTGTMTLDPKALSDLVPKAPPTHKAQTGGLGGVAAGLGVGLAGGIGAGLAGGLSSKALSGAVLPVTGAKYGTPVVTNPNSNNGLAAVGGAGMVPSTPPGADGREYSTPLSADEDPWTVVAGDRPATSAGDGILS
jgi:uncharacterized protein YukE